MIKVAAWPNPSASAHWRLEAPFKYLNRTGEFECRVINDRITEEIAQWADIYILQSVIDREGIALLYMYQQEYGKKIIVDADDYPKVEKHNPYKIEHDISGAPAVIKRTMEIADMITTTTPYLARKLKKINPNVVVLPNYMDMERWDLPRLTNEADEVRVGWVGSITHEKDIKLIRKALIDLMLNRPQVKLIFMGDLRFKDLFPGFNVECYLGVPFDAYPSKLRALRLDIGIAPLRDTEFNRCKSPIKTFEYGICGVPVIASKMGVYQAEIKEDKTGLLAYSDGTWLTYLEILVDDVKRRKKLGEALYNHVKNERDIKRHIHKWVKAYKSLIDTPTRKDKLAV